MPISPELAAVYTSAPTARYYVETLSLSHPAMPDEGNGTIRYITNQRDGWTGTLEDGSTVATFEYLPFSVVPPRQEGEGQVTLAVAIGNASRGLMDELEALASQPTEPISCVYRVYLSDDTTVVQNDPPIQLSIMSVTATQTVISFNAGLTNLRQRPFPKVLYTVEQFPGLDR
jgi:hypothetical protein